MWLKVLIQLVGIHLVLMGCRSRQTNTRPNTHFQTVDYVTVGQRLQHLQTPYVIDLAKDAKHLVFIGCNHVRDSTDAQFAAIRHQFAQLNPQIALNEGGQVRASQLYPSMATAVWQAGETGCLKYLSDQAGIQLLNGDTPDSVEFALALKYYPKQELYLYYVMERIVIPYVSQPDQQEPFEPYFTKVVQSFVSRHFPLTSEEQSLPYFKRLYHHYMKRPFVLGLTEAIEQFDYINGGKCHFCAVGRRSKMLRDSILLTKLDGALDEYDRVIVTFGRGHAVAVEPALRQLINKKRR